MLQITREQASIYINADYWRFYIHFKEISKKALCTRNRFLFSFLSKDGSQGKCKSEATHKFRTFSSFAFSSSSTARVSGVALSPGGFLTLQPLISIKSSPVALSIFSFNLEMTSTALTETSSPMYNTSEPTSPRVKTTQQSTSAATESNSSSSHTAPSTIESTETAHSTTTENTRATLKERRISTSQVPASTEAEWKSTGSIHDVKSYRNEEMLSRKVMGVSLKYVIIASSSFVVVVFVSFLLVCQLCKRRCVNGVHSPSFDSIPRRVPGASCYVYLARTLLSEPERTWFPKRISLFHFISEVE